MSVEMIFALCFGGAAAAAGLSFATAYVATEAPELPAALGDALLSVAAALVAGLVGLAVLARAAVSGALATSPLTARHAPGPYRDAAGRWRDPATKRFVPAPVAA